MCICLLSNSSSAEETISLKSPKEKLGYSMGVTFVRDFQKMNLDIDTDALVKGIKDAASGSPLLLDEPEIRRLINTYKFDQMQKRGNLKQPPPSP